MGTPILRQSFYVKNVTKLTPTSCVWTGSSCGTAIVSPVLLMELVTINFALAVGINGSKPTINQSFKGCFFKQSALPGHRSKAILLFLILKTEKSCKYKNTLI